MILEVYKGLTTQLEQAKDQGKGETPVFTALEPGESTYGKEYFLFCSLF